MHVAVEEREGGEKQQARSEEVVSGRGVVWKKGRGDARGEKVRKSAK